MSDKPTASNPLMDAWLAGQKAFLDAQAPFWQELSQGSLPDTSDPDQLSILFRRVNEQCRSLFDAMAAIGGLEDEPEENVARQTLRRMLDPMQFSYAGVDEVNQVLLNLVEGTDVPDLMELERQRLKATREWAVLKREGTEYRAVTAMAWARVYRRFLEEVGEDLASRTGIPYQHFETWLRIANDELIRMQRSEEYLDAQRRVLRAGLNYRERERKLIENWCETRSIPTRSEIDDLHGIVYGLRKEVRALKRQVAERHGTVRKRVNTANGT